MASNVEDPFVVDDHCELCGQFDSECECADDATCAAVSRSGPAVAALRSESIGDAAPLL